MNDFVFSAHTGEGNPHLLTALLATDNCVHKTGCFQQDDRAPIAQANSISNCDSTFALFGGVR
jgi:hypothetical protein